LTRTRGAIKEDRDVVAHRRRPQPSNRQQLQQPPTRLGPARRGQPRRRRARRRDQPLAVRERPERLHRHRDRHCRRRHATTDTVNGGVDDVRLYNRAVTDAEVSQIFNAGGSG
jgi:hypothetical protein